MGETNGKVAQRTTTDLQLTAGRTETPEPPLPEWVFWVGGPAGHSWRETALTRVHELRTLSTYFQHTNRSVSSPLLVEAIDAHLTAAEQAAVSRAGLGSVLWGSAVERARSNLDAAEADVLRIASDGYVSGQLPSLQAHVRQHLPADDPRREALERIAGRSPKAVAGEERDVVIAAARGASSEARREGARVRSFRNVLLVTAGLMTMAAIGLATLGITSPETLAVCFRPEDKVVCPTAAVDLPGPQSAAGTAAGPADSDDIAAAEARAVNGWDVPLIMLVGMVSAAVAGAAALRSIKGTSNPYSVPVALAVLKLPTGALTALLGLLLMRGQFIPGLSALDFPAQILAWAIVFGYAQQLFTRFVDQQGQSVLDAAGGPRPPATA